MSVRAPRIDDRVPPYAAFVFSHAARSGDRYAAAEGRNMMRQMPLVGYSEEWYWLHARINLQGMTVP